MRTEKCGQYLFNNREKIIENWEKIASQNVYAAGKTSNLVLRNHLPHFLENLSSILTSADTKKSSSSHVRDNLKVKFSKQHGRARAATPHYNISQLTHEYIILRNVIHEALSSEDLLDLNSAEIISSAIEWSNLEASKVFVESIQDLQEKLVGTIAHDLRNPISTAYSAVELLEDETVPKVEVSGLIHRSLKRALTLLDALLDSAQIVAGEGMTFRFENFDVAAEIKDAGAEAGRVYDNSIIFPSTDRPITGTFDRMAVRRVVENLVSNAIKYGGINTPVSIDFIDSEDFVTIAINNKGSYIKKEDQEKIFNFFARQSDESVEEKQGWGLGLSLVKLVAKAHEGKAWVESSEEEGTTFHLQLARNVHPAGKTFSQCF